MQTHVDTETCRFALAKSDRQRLEHELDMLIALKTGESTGLGAIEDRELILDGWALLDAIEGRDAPVRRVERIVRAMDEWSAAEILGMRIEDAERENESRALFTGLLDRLPKPKRAQALRQLRPSIAEGC